MPLFLLIPHFFRKKRKNVFWRCCLIEGKIIKFRARYVTSVKEEGGYYFIIAKDEEKKAEGEGWEKLFIMNKDMSLHTFFPYSFLKRPEIILKLGFLSVEFDEIYIKLGEFSPESKLIYHTFFKGLESFSPELACKEFIYRRKTKKWEKR